MNTVIKLLLRPLDRRNDMGRIAHEMPEFIEVKEIQLNRN